MIGSATIHLTRGYSVTVDADDYERLIEMAPFGWRAVGKDARYIYAKATIGNSFVAMHRVVTCAAQGLVVDHINRNTLDNRKNNLRVVSSGKNIIRGVWLKKPVSGYRGVRSLPDGRFYAAVRRPEKVHCGPVRELAEQAAQDYDAIALRVHGEFAVLNFPQAAA